METKIAQRTIKTKYIPKSFLKSQKILFGNETLDKSTGELISNQFQVTLYLVDGSKSNSLPTPGLSIKMGNRSFNLISEMADMERSMRAALEFVINNREILERMTVEQRNAYYKKLELEKEANLASKNDTSAH